MEDKWEGFSSESDDETLSIAQRLEIVGEKTGIGRNNEGAVREEYVVECSGNSGLGDIGRLLRDNVSLVSREEEAESDWIESAVKPKAKKQKKRRRARPPISFTSQFPSAAEYSSHFLEMVDAEFEIEKEQIDNILRGETTFELDHSGKSLLIKVEIIDDFVCGDILDIHIHGEDEPIQQRITDIYEDEKVLEVEMTQTIALRDVRKVRLKDTYIHSKMVSTLCDFSLANPAAEIVLGRPEQVQMSMVPAINPEVLTGLNPSQVSAVRSALSRSFSLIQGPPGSGKTKTAAAIVRCVAKPGKHLLVCASSNTAADQLAISLAKLGCFTAQEAEVKMVRLYSHGKEKNSPLATKEFSFHYLLRDMLIEKYPNVAWRLEALKIPTRRDMQLIFDEEPQKVNIKNDGVVLLSQFDIVCCTIASSVSAFVTESKSFAFALVDEAAFSPEAETLMAIHSSCRKVVLIGDPLQLPPVVKSDYAISGGYTISMFERLMSRCGMEVSYLDIQYRMLPVISRFPREMFYKGRLVDGEPVKRMRPSAEISRFFSRAPIVLFDCEGTEERRPNTYSFFNTKEAQAVTRVLLQLSKAGVPGESIGVIAPYDAQRRLLVQSVAKLTLDDCTEKSIFDDWKKAVEIRSIDGYQGREKDIVVISTVRSGNKIGFLSDYRRINVALTRAKFGLILVGKFKTLQMNETWGRFLQYAKSVGDQRSVDSLE